MHDHQHGIGLGPLQLIGLAKPRHAAHIAAMVRNALVASLLLALAASPATADTRRIGITSYTRIVVLGDMVVDVVPDYRLYAQADGSRDALDTLDLDVSNDTLTISQAAEGPFGPRRTDAGPIHIRLTGQNISDITLRGAGSLTVGQLRGSDITVGLDGAGTINASVTAGGNIRTRASGSGTITLTGRADSLEGAVTGSASIVAADLALRDLTLRQTGTGSSSFAASRTASIIATGQANVTVAGRARCTVNNLGAGNVSCGADQRRALPGAGESTITPGSR